MDLNEFSQTLEYELRLMNAHQEIATGAVVMKNYLEDSGKSRYVLGLSGGLDSAVVALWAAQAVGGERLTLVALPYGLGLTHHSSMLLDRSSNESVESARRIAEMIPGAKFLEIDIADSVDAVLEAASLVKMDPSGAPDSPWKMAAANAKARVRASILRTITNVVDGLLLGTENRSESLLGYFTLGGDDQADFEPLWMFFKSQVRQLAYGLDVPEDIIQKAPSADLWGGQTDEQELGFSYEHADLILYYSGGKHDLAGTKSLMLRGLDSIPGRKQLPEWVDTVAPRVLKQRDKTEFKRKNKPYYLTANRTYGY